MPVRVMAMIFVLAFVIGLGLGMLLTKSSFCYASTLTDIYLFRASRTGAGVVVATLLALASFSTIFWLRGSAGFWTPSWGLFSVIGGFIFGVGMVTAGACVTSTLFRVGTGKVRYLVTLCFMGIGYVVYGMFYLTFRDEYFTPLWVGSGGTLFESTSLPAPLVALGVSCLVLLVYATVVGHIEIQFSTEIDGSQSLYRHLREGSSVLIGRISRYVSSMRRPVSVRKRLRRPWRPVTAGIGIAGLVTTWLWIHRVWTVSGPESKWVVLIAAKLGFSPGTMAWWTTSLYPGGNALITPDMVLIVGILVGAFSTSVLDGSFDVRWPERPVLPYAAGGGFLMGIGSRIAPGCNIANLFTGVAELSIHSLVASVGIVTGAYVATRFLY